MEKVFNFFLYLDGQRNIEEIGYVTYLMKAADAEIEEHLKRSALQDYKKARRFKLSKRMNYTDYVSMCRLGTHQQLFESIFQKEDAIADPISCITTIINDRPTIDMAIGHERLTTGHLMAPEYGDRLDVPDYLEMYMSPSGLDIPRLINDDFFIAIKLLFNSQKYVSAAKLIVSCIDSLAFIEYGDKPGVFQRWLNEYVDLAKHRVSGDELWELRNSLLHMTGGSSRKVSKGQVAAVTLCVGLDPNDYKLGDDVSDSRYLELRSFITTLGKGIEKWLHTYNRDRSKFELFVSRYDMILSDVRVATPRGEIVKTTV